MNLDLRDIPVLYINMDKDVEKRERIENHIDRLGFKTKIRVPGVAHRDGPLAGCALAHYLSLIHITAPKRQTAVSYALFTYKKITRSPGCGGRR